MKSIRISDSDHAELVKRRDQSGVSIIFQVSKMIAEKKENNNGKTEKPSTLPILSE